MNPKYSIIIPAKNGVKYLPTCIESIIRQDYNDYELIISDDHSEDYTKEYLGQLKHPNIVITEPPHPMSMTEHWEWALSLAKAEWLIFVGQDDGLQPYFFQLADKLTAIAKKKNIRTIMSKRAYYFWPGCNAVYGDSAVGYYATNQSYLENSKFQGLRALLGFQDYFELPQMYTTSLFHRAILDEVRSKQNGNVFITHPQDANLAAIACSLEPRYLKSEIPLGWIGSSPKSAGMAIGAKDMNNIECKKDLEKLRTEYEEKIKKSALKYNPLAGDFSFGSCIIYFWQALLQTNHLRNSFINMFIESKFFKTIMFVCVFAEMNNSKMTSPDKFMPEFRKILGLNNCDFNTILFYSKIKVPEFIHVFIKLIYLPIRLIRKLSRMIHGHKLERISYEVSWIDNSDISMSNVSAHILCLLNEKYFIEKLSM